MISRIINRLSKFVQSKEKLEQKYLKESIKKLHLFGDEVIQNFLSIEKETNINFDLSFGTLLGAYREHGFIPHDNDVDVIVGINNLSRDLIDILRQRGFELNRLFVTSDFIGCQLPMKYKGLTCDIYFTYKINNQFHTFVPHPIFNMDWAYCEKHNIFRSNDIIIPYFKERVKCKFNDYEVLIPDNSEEILAHTYGKDFMTPKKGVITKVPEVSLSEKFFTAFPIELTIKENIIDKLRENSLEYK